MDQEMTGLIDKMTSNLYMINGWIMIQMVNEQTNTQYVQIDTI